MAYADFTLSGLTQQFGLAIEDRTDLFGDVPEVALRPSFQAQEDMKRGYAQCLAEMLAAHAFNEREGRKGEKVFGAVTTGIVWTFLELEGATARIDARDYYIERVGKIVGILLHLLSPDGRTGQDIDMRHEGKE